jgi:hypothetical protein
LSARGIFEDRPQTPIAKPPDADAL